MLSTTYKGFTTENVTVSGNSYFTSLASFASGLVIEGDLIQNGIASTTELRALKVIVHTMRSLIIFFKCLLM